MACVLKSLTQLDEVENAITLLNQTIVDRIDSLSSIDASMMIQQIDDLRVSNWSDSCLQYLLLCKRFFLRFLNFKMRIKFQLREAFLFTVHVSVSIGLCCHAVILAVLRNYVKAIVCVPSSVCLQHEWIVA